MTSVGDINLLKTKSPLSPRSEAIELQLRSSSMWGLILFVAIGVLAGGWFLIMQLRLNSLKSARSQLVKQIAAESQKEGLLLTVKDRVAVAEKVLATQTLWPPVFDKVVALAQPPILTAITNDEQQRINMAVGARSLDEALNVTSALIAIAEDKQVRLPQLKGLTVDREGNIRLVLNFYPVF